MIKEKLLISSCLLGFNVKYNGKNNCLDSKTLQKLKDKYEFFSFCPEVEGGLPTPRTPCEICSTTPLKVINKDGIDKTANFTKGAELTLELCKKENITKALLKANSPSCSSKYIYDGNFNGSKIKGDGVSTKLLRNNNIAVISEEDYFLNDTLV